jgi:hypothetical protein
VAQREDGAASGAVEVLAALDAEAEKQARYQPDRDP